MFCSNCGNELPKAKDAKFCATCGNAIGEPQPQAQNEPAAKKPSANFFEQVNKAKDAVKSSNSGLALGKLGQLKDRLGKKFNILIASAIAGVILIVGGISVGVSAYQITADESPSLTDLLSADEIESLAKAQCSAVDGLILSQAERKTYQSQLGSLSRVNSNSDARGALAFRDKNYWTYDTLPDVEKEFGTKTHDALDGLLAANGRIVPSDYNEILDSVNEDFKSEVLANCGLESAFSDMVSFTTSYNLAQASLMASADSAPWYPEGYYEAANGELAWKWVDRYSDCYSCRYWHVQVIAKTGCPGGVYAETNLNQNGAVVDWTNDSLPSLAAGQVAVLEFQSYNDNIETASPPDFNCHK